MSQEFSINSFDEFVGQEKLISTIKIIIESAKVQKKQIDHLLFYGPPGLGKTTLAKIISKETKSNIVYVQGPLIEKKGDVLTIFSSINDNDIIFIDEIHGINKNIEELFYSALEEGTIDVALGVDGDKKIMRMKLKKFCLIAATTKINLLSKPLKDRFGYIGKLSDYSDLEIAKIIFNSATKNKIKIKNDAINFIAIHSGQTPRVANTLLKRVNDFAIYYKIDLIDLETVKKAFSYLGIYLYGLYSPQIEYLKTLHKVFNDKFSSLDAISSIIKDDKYTILNDIEPILLIYKLIEKSPRGRKITNNGIEYLKSQNIIT